MESQNQPEEQDPSEDLARTVRPDGQEVINDAALGTRSTNPDFQRDAAARGADTSEERKPPAGRGESEG